MTADLNALPARQRILLTAHDLFYQEDPRHRHRSHHQGIWRHQGDVLPPLSQQERLDYGVFGLSPPAVASPFSKSLARHVAQTGGLLAALAPCPAEWFDDPRFRGCAFINTAVELADLLPESLHIAGQHKRQMADELARHLPARGNSTQRCWRC